MTTSIIDVRLIRGRDGTWRVRCDDAWAVISRVIEVEPVSGRKAFSLIVLEEREESAK